MPTLTERTRRGAILIYAIVLMLIVLAMASLGIDYGHVQLVKSELQTGIDAAALAGAGAYAAATLGQANALAVNSAVAIAAGNQANGRAVGISSADVSVGNWDTLQTPSFSSARLPTNAVAVNGYCDTAHGNPVSLTFASLLGAASCDVHASAIALITGPPSSYGIVGVDRASFSSLGVISRINGNLVSNGDVTVGMPLGLLVAVTGNAQSFSGYVSTGALANVAGSTRQLSKQLNFPPVILPASNNNAAISSYLDSYNNFIGIGRVVIPPGTYVVNDLDLLIGLDLQIQGKVTFYVRGRFNVAVAVNLLGNSNFDPSNFSVKVCGSGSVNFLGDLLTPVCMDLYAPGSDININVAVSQYTGTLIGKTLSINVPLLSSFNELVPPTPASTISLVQ